MNRTIFRVLLPGLAILLTACSTTPDEEEVTLQSQIDELKVQVTRANKNAEKAIKLAEEANKSAAGAATSATRAADSAKQAAVYAKETNQLLNEVAGSDSAKKPAGGN